MYKKLISLLVTFVALGGGSLAVALPIASAESAHDGSSQYCEYTEDSQYSEDCASPSSATPAAASATATSTSATSTIAAPSSSPTTTASSVDASPVVLGADGVARLDVAALSPGEAFDADGVAVSVLAQSSDGLRVSFGGVAADVASTAAVTVSANGAVTITNSVADGKRVPAIKLAGANPAFTLVATTSRQQVILPQGSTSDSFTYALTSGVSFDTATTAAQIGRDFTVQAAGSGIPVNVAHTVSTNSARTAVTVKLARSERSFIVKLNLASLHYTAAEKAAILEHQITTLSPKLKVKTTAGLDTFAFSYLL